MDLAVAGHDFFEVAFYYQAGSAPSSADVIARTSWELMKNAQIKGVRGKGDGETSVDYSKNAIYREQTRQEWEIIGWTNDDPPLPVNGWVTYTDIAPDLGAGDGAAILFVGKKTDKTLLGVGKLTHVNGDPGTLITTTTRSVTFTVAALECGVGYPNTSFLTNYLGPIGPTSTKRDVISLSGLQFDMFRLRNISESGNNLTAAEYHFNASDVPSVDAPSLNGYRLGIIVTGDGSYGKKQPRYPRANGQFQYFSVMLDDKTIIQPRNNTTVGNPFMNPVEVLFDTSFTTPGSMFAFVFEIPVCPLYFPVTGGPPDPGAGTWYIRASYDSFWLDLDDGSLRNTKGAGGAVLIGTGTVSEASAYRIRTIIPPNKYLYTYANGTANSPDDTDNRYFNVNGLLVVLEYYNGDFIRYLSTDELTFEIGMKTIIPRADPNMPNPNPSDPHPSLTAGDLLSRDLYGIQTVKFNYFHPQSGVTHTDTFVVICDNSKNQYTDIPQSHYIVIDANVKNGDIPDYLNTRLKRDPGKATYVIIINKSFNFEGQLNLDYASATNDPYLLIFVAGRNSPSGDAGDPVSYDYDQRGYLYENEFRVGRTSSTLSNGVFRAWGTTNAFYFGKWPFNEELWGYPAFSLDDYHNLGTRRRYSYLKSIPNTPTGTRTRHVTFNYLINGYGEYNSEFSPGVTPQSTGTGNSYFIRDGHGGRFFNVTLDRSLSTRNYGNNQSTQYNMTYRNIGWIY